MTQNKDAIDLAHDALVFVQHRDSMWRDDETVNNALKALRQHREDKSVDVDAKVIEALRSISQGICDAHDEGKDWPETRDYQLVLDHLHATGRIVTGDVTERDKNADKDCNHGQMIPNGTKEALEALERLMAGGVKHPQQLEDIEIVRNELQGVGEKR